jgi:hypothetical protein
MYANYILLYWDFAWASIIKCLVAFSQDTWNIASGQYMINKLQAILCILQYERDPNFISNNDLACNISSYKSVVSLLGNILGIAIWIQNKASILEYFSNYFQRIKDIWHSCINFLVMNNDNGFLFYCLRNGINKLSYAIPTPLRLSLFSLN